MRRFFAVGVVLGLAAAAWARPKSEVQAIILLNGAPSSAAVAVVTDGGVGTLAAAAPGDAIRFQCDNPVRYAVGASFTLADAGIASEYVVTQDPRVVFLPDTAASVYFQPVDGGATCIRWVLR